MFRLLGWWKTLCRNKAEKKEIFTIDDSEPTALVEFKEKYFAIEVTKTENIMKKLGDPDLRKTILEDLKKISKRKFISEIMSKINQNKFS